MRGGFVRRGTAEFSGRIEMDQHREEWWDEQRNVVPEGLVSCEPAQGRPALDVLCGFGTSGMAVACAGPAGLTERRASRNV
eukprot:9608495-Ditylum_brightwellii.AAC.1